METEHHQHRPVTRSWVFWTFVAFAAVGVWFLFTYHPKHTWQYLPAVLLLACPLLHVLGHRGHRH